MKKLVLMLSMVLPFSQNINAQAINTQTIQQITKSEISKLFVIQNVATEKTRVYERCDDTPGCPHKLIFESDMVVGRSESGTKDDPYAFVTQLGHSRIKSWVKFYQDKNGHYPHWYQEGQSLETIPEKAPRNSSGQPEPTMGWGKKWMKNDTIYGAFGWYAALLTPSNRETGVNYQWIHGTIGWASDKNAPIQLTRTWLLNLVSDPGSSGCTRLSNDQVSYLRHILPAGTDIFRVYAHEATRENPCAKTGFFGKCKKENIFESYKNQATPLKWNYIMLTDDAQKTNGLTADAATIESLQIPVIEGQNLIEKGTAEIKQYPTAIGINYIKSASSGLSGDRYSIDDPTGTEESHFKGVFLVDEGKFINYEHPNTEKTQTKIRVGGFENFKSNVPDSLKTDGSYYQTPPAYLKKNQY